jgi:hypothetical protein
MSDEERKDPAVDHDVLIADPVQPNDSNNSPFYL